jgi:hypothetical protein
MQRIERLTNILIFFRKRENLLYRGLGSVKK